MRSTTHRTAPGASDSTPSSVEVTHPFHPLRGRRFEVLGLRRSRHGDRVWVRWPDGGSRTFPSGWTSLGDVDAWQGTVHGSTQFRLDDLAQLAGLVEGVREVLGGEAGGDV